MVPVLGILDGRGNIMRPLKAVFLCAGVLFLGNLSPVFSQCNGQERWSVKTGADGDVSKITNANNPTTTTISDLTSHNGSTPRSKKELNGYPNSRVSPDEMTVWKVTGTLTDYKCECDPAKGDGDYHLVIVDKGVSMVVEIPNHQSVNVSHPSKSNI